MAIWDFLEILLYGSRKVVKKAKAWVSRDARVRFKELDGISFRCKTEQGEKAYPVANVSSTGIALIIREQQPAIGSVLVGILNVGDLALELKLQVVRIEVDLVGARMMENSPELSKELNGAFGLEIAASKMIKMRPDLLAESPDGNPHCFTGNNDCRLYFIEKDGVIQQFDICFFGFVIEGFKDQKLRFGNLYEGAPFNDIRKKKTVLLDVVHDTADEMKNDAIRFVGGIEFLDGSVKENLVRAIREGKL